MADFRIVPATADDVPLILELIRGLAEYEKLAHECVATEASLEATLFGDRPAAEVLLAYEDKVCVGIALFFVSYSTFLAKAGIYLEDLFVKEAYRGKGYGLALLKELARIACRRDYGRIEWSVLNWNEPSIQFYKKLGAFPLDEWTRYRLTGDDLTALGK